MQRILIDGRFVGVGDSMTRYILEILKCLLPLDKENEYTLLLRPQGVEITKQFLGEQNVISKDPALLKKGLETEKSPDGQWDLSSMTRRDDSLAIEVLDIPHYSLAEQTKLLSYLNQKKFDLVHFIQFNHPVRYRGKFVVTIHDLTLINYGEGYGWLKQLGFKKIMESAVKNSAKIVTISNTSKEEIVRFYGIDPDKVAVTHLAVDPQYNPRIKDKELRIKQFKDKYQIQGDYILYTGMWKKHKNLLRMLEAFEALSQNAKVNPLRQGYEGQESQNDNSKFKNLQLVLAGKIDNHEPEVLKLIDEINERIMNYELGIKNKKSDDHNSLFTIHNSNRLKPIITTGFLGDEDLPVAYSGALAYCIPSLSEGFGLPPLEAMACGTPVISSSISAMPEILGDAPLYFNPLDVSDIAKAMEKVITDQDLREKLIKKGLDQVKKYSWEETAKKTLEVYKEAIAFS